MNEVDKAREIIEPWARNVRGCHRVELVKAIASALSQAVEAEKERCINTIEYVMSCTASDERIIGHKQAIAAIRSTQTGRAIAEDIRE